jgi:acid phosphatase (class A)
MLRKILSLIQVLVPALAFAQSTSPVKPFVTPDQLSGTAILPSPPSNDSWKTLRELAELHRLESTRTAEQIAHAQADDREESMFAYADVMGPNFSRSSLPKVALLSDHVKRNESVIVNPSKKFFQRPRPYHLDTTLHPVCKKTENRADFSYPSGHGTTGYLEAFVLAQIAPEKRDAILARADDYAHSREVCGVHYASDEAASKALAYAMFGLMMNNPQFKAELDDARSEWHAATKP